MRGDAVIGFGEDGCINRWSSAVAELTGYDAQAVEGGTFEQLIAPLRLSSAYRAAAIECVCNIIAYGHVAAPGNELSDVDSYVCVLFPDRPAVIDKFPLPLPVSNRDPRYYIELLIEPAAHMGQRSVSGDLFVLRRAHSGPVPLLAVLCKKVLGFDPTDTDGSLSTHPVQVTTTSTVKKVDSQEHVVLIKPRTPAEVAMLQEIVDTVRRVMMSQRRTSFAFTRPYNQEQPDFYARVVAKLGGAEAVCESIKNGNQLCWWPRLGDWTRRVWDLFEQEHSRLLATLDNHVTDTGVDLGSPILPFIPISSDPRFVRLTIKIEIDCEESEWCHRGVTPGGAKSATIAVPASWSMHQLHRAVLNATELHSFGHGSIHNWDLKGPDCSARVLVPGRDESGESDMAATFRQRVHIHGAFVNLDSSSDNQFSGIGSMTNAGQLQLCEYRTLAGGIFYRPGITVGLTDGYTRHGTEYKLKLESMAVSDKKVLPTCLGGSKFAKEDSWNAREATRVLRKDPYLRRTRKGLHKCPTALQPRYVQRVFFNRARPITANSSAPLATCITGLDGRPVSHPGEPPLRQREGDSEYRRYLLEDPEGYTKIPHKHTKHTWGGAGAHDYYGSGVDESSGDAFEGNSDGVSDVENDVEEVQTSCKKRKASTSDGLIPQPRGRPRRGMVWDPVSGGWVPQ